MPQVNFLNRRTMRTQETSNQERFRHSVKEYSGLDTTPSNDLNSVFRNFKRR
jgi:hypothetical protein